METLEFIIALVSTLLSFSLVGFIFFYFIHIRNKERMALIEKGADASMFYTPKKNNPFAVLKWALLIIGIAFGIFVGLLLDHYTDLDEPIYFAMILLFGGIGLLTYFFIARRNAQNSDK